MYNLGSESVLCDPLSSVLHADVLFSDWLSSHHRMAVSSNCDNTVTCSSPGREKEGDGKEEWDRGGERAELGENCSPIHSVMFFGPTGSPQVLSHPDQ